MTQDSPDLGPGSSPEPRWLDAGQQKVWRSYLLGSTLLQDRIDEDLRRSHGLSGVEYEILVRLSEAEGRLRMAQLASSLAHSRSRVTHTVKRMEAAGLVQRCGSQEDRRGVVCQLTDHGYARLVAAAPGHVETVRSALIDLVSPEDLAAFGRVMDAVCDRLISAHPERELRA
ncbi:winged helix-turn-helix transcriptional regulator [Nocardioides sp. zg-536]|uniref:Winged helix-turn-helix transcriptional regulator n=1 Tax=Nocardioides faecalis TaxID=2803858 RepID=A0A938Y9R9_9ACTN|nr:MarR family winged helix-turn-helix transcriptional regulator [Nocardioides faecalis]MBM9460733.1 winged helix-turn-helix transcriptional regulator [Nocardioides faecalis]MBS4752672.1 winged helix-turn-helix transcriptional regulator [Nocardioides faecalis]QVI57934.1 winged helix-turn-helix transcriptional regulator [Nocardioides faecalis]